MRVQPTAPTGQPQTFDVNETFFSTTDARGVISAGNTVFCRTSGYTVSELIGQPHNLIRHPDMPRLVFRQLWQTVRAGRSFMGYVKNQAKNGNHYWVFAVIVPIPQGYLSVRIKPTSPLLASVEALYRELAQKEATAIAAGESEANAAEAAGDTLKTAVLRLGFASYDAFSHHALNTEIKSRDAEIRRRSLRLFPSGLAEGEGDELNSQLRALYGRTLEAYSGINALFASLDAFAALCRGIEERKNAVQDISEDFRLNALNAHIAAHPLGLEGVTLGTVAQILNGHGQTLSRNVSVLADSILGTTAALADITSNLSSARIQVEMLLSFLAELASGGHAGDETQRRRSMVEDLRLGFSTTVQHAFRAVDAVRGRLPEILATKEQLRKDIVFLQVAQISGLIEVSRLRNAEGLQATFTGLRDKIDSGKRELEQLDSIVDQLKALTESTPPKVKAIEQSMQHLQAAATGAGVSTGAAAKNAPVARSHSGPRHPGRSADPAQEAGRAALVPA